MWSRDMNDSEAKLHIAVSDSINLYVDQSVMSSFSSPGSESEHAASATEELCS